MVDTDILLVDDDPDANASMSDIFVDLGYTVDLAHDGPSALELCKGHQYRVALLDYKMIGMNGLDLCQHLVRLQPAIEVSLITGFLPAPTDDAATEVGCRCVLMKPVDLEVLIPLVQRAAGGMSA